MGLHETARIKKAMIYAASSGLVVRFFDDNLNLELVFNLLIFKTNIFVCISSGTRLGTHKMRVLLIWYDTTKGNQSALIVILGVGLAALKQSWHFSGESGVKLPLVLFFATVG
ncbi:MAG: hypothetical protein Q8N96_00845 [Methylovulum sp.]|nr:hypothetical protein [Methylovulum sp.]